MQEIYLSEMWLHKRDLLWPAGDCWQVGVCAQPNRNNKPFAWSRRKYTFPLKAGLCECFLSVDWVFKNSSTTLCFVPREIIYQTYTLCSLHRDILKRERKKEEADTNTVKTTVDKLGQSTSFLCKGIYITTYVCNMYIFCAENITQAWNTYTFFRPHTSCQETRFWNYVLNFWAKVCLTL